MLEKPAVCPPPTHTMIAVSVVRCAVATDYAFGVEDLELMDHVYACILNTSHYDESVIEVCWEWIDALERPPRMKDARVVSSSQLSIYYAYHMVRDITISGFIPTIGFPVQLQTNWGDSRIFFADFSRARTYASATESCTVESGHMAKGQEKFRVRFSYLWSAAVQLWKPFELDRLDILCSWSYLALQFADAVDEDTIELIEVRSNFGEKASHGIFGFALFFIYYEIL
ncbi:unnamed protein product [Cylicostephanus goldi]|uniref:Uncharacterized protein n=1 Tax=Cylicostephanus goldi TaxID=71465 RepID=A0A3P6QZN7_CYLGO|nr:unnamed protein product [Cylicostephanus goldi]